MRQYRIVLRKEARDEAVTAARYILQEAGKQTAVRWYEGLAEAMESLQTWPLRCPLARENSVFRNVELRQLLYQSHRIIFCVEEEIVHILHVRHIARDDLDQRGGTQ